MYSRGALHVVSILQMQLVTNNNCMVCSAILLNLYELRFSPCTPPCPCHLPSHSYPNPLVPFSPISLPPDCSYLKDSLSEPLFSSRTVTATSMRLPSTPLASPSWAPSAWPSAWPSIQAHPPRPLIGCRPLVTHWLPACLCLWPSATCWSRQ